MLGPTLETDRLILRPPEAQDFEPWAAFGADEEAAVAATADDVVVHVRQV